MLKNRWNLEAQSTHSIWHEDTNNFTKSSVDLKTNIFNKNQYFIKQISFKFSCVFLFISLYHRFTSKTVTTENSNWKKEMKKSSLTTSGFCHASFLDHALPKPKAPWACSQFSNLFSIFCFISETRQSFLTTQFEPVYTFVIKLCGFWEEKWSDFRRNRIKSDERRKKCVPSSTTNAWFLNVDRVYFLISRQQIFDIFNHFRWI
jgi:hypothetical protein